MRAFGKYPRTRRGLSHRRRHLNVKWLNTLTALLLFAGLFANFVTVSPIAAQQQDNTPPPYPAPNVVVAVGSFQTAVGCGQEFDKECQATQLQPNSDGVWTGTFPIPAGSYTYRIVTRSDIDRSFGEGGDPDGDDISLDVPDGALGVFFSFNQWTGELYAVPVLNQVELSTDVGQFPMRPLPNGAFYAVVDTDPGLTFGAQVILDGNPVGDIISVDAGEDGRAVVRLGEGGNLSADTVRPATLTILKTDADGNPLTGSCFSVYDGDDVAGQACDVDNGEDGATTIEFPVGAGNNLTLAESRTPDGQDTVESQDIDLDPGDNQVTVSTGGGAQPPVDEETPTEEVAPQGVTVDFIMIDDAGNQIIGGCLQLEGYGEQCDDDQDGLIRFEGVAPNQSYSISETAAPDGYEPFPGASIDVGEGDSQFQVPHTAAVVEPQAGGLAITSTDDQGNLLTGNCFTVTPRDDTAGEEQTACDGDDGSDDGVTNFANLNAGGWRVSQASGTEGFNQAEAFNVTINPGEVTQETAINPQSGGGVGTLTLFSVDENGNPVPGVCYEVTGFDEVQCDEDGDGDMGLTEVPAGDYGARQSTVPDGYQLDEQEQSVTVESGGDASLTFTSPTSQAETHTVTVTVLDQDGNLIPGACFTTTDGNGNTSAEQCDEDQSGDVQVELTDGDYTLTMSTTPDGYQTADDQPFTVAGENLDLTVTVTATEQPTEAGAGNGAVDVAVTDQDGFAIIGACVQIDGPVSGEICDNGDGDANGQDGLIRIENLPDGDYTVSVSQLPEGFDPAPPSNVSITGGQTADAVLISGGAVEEEPTATEAPATGSLLIRKYDPERASLPGSCFTLTDTSGNEITACDNQDGDTDDRDGRIRFADLTPGDYTVTETQAPEGYTAGEPKSITIVAGETARMNFTNALALGTVAINTGDGANAIGGACYELSGIGQQCDDDADGTVLFESVPPGDYTATQISVPDGYAPSDPVDQPVTVTAGETSQVTYVIAVAQASLLVSVADEGGAAVGGACITVNDGAPVCDDDGTDANGAAGQIQIDGLAPGDVTVTMSTTPEGYTDGGSTTVTLAAGEQSNVTFTLSVAMGRLGIYTTAPDGSPLGGACYALNGGEPICDNGDGDENGDPGVIRVTNVAPGDYTISQTTVPEGYQQAADQTFTVSAGQRTRIDFVNEPALGAIRAAIADVSSGELVGGACISSDGFEGEICDNGEGDANPDAGVIRVENVAPGTYTVSVSTAPEGYGAGEGVQVTVESNQTAEANLSVAVQTGNLTVSVTDADGNQIPGACITLTDTGGTATEVCDNNDPDQNSADGVITVPNLQPGDYTVIVSSVPDGYQMPDIGATASVPAGGEGTAELPLALIPPTETATETATVEPTVTETETAVPTETVTEAPVATDTPAEEPTETPQATETEAGVVIPPAEQTGTAQAGAESPTAQPPVATGSIRINLTDPDGNVLVGACFSASSETASGEVCDNDSADQASADGIVEIGSLPVGEYLVSEVQAPDGYTAAAEQDASIANDGDVVELTFVNDVTPVATGNLRIISLNQDGDPAGGGCYQVSTSEVCDNLAGDADNAPGVVLIEAIPVGDYTVGETEAPEGFGAAADQDVTIEADGTAEVSFTHEPAAPESGGVTMQLRDQDGNPAEGACVVLSSEQNDIDGRQYCDNGEGDQDPEAGQLEVTDLPVGSYSARQLPSEVSGSQALGAATFDQSTFTVKANQIIVVIVIIIIELPEVGDLQITKRAADTNALQTGACFRVTGEGNEIEVCDNDDVDLNGSNGLIRLEDLSSGDYLIEEITAPPGYQLAPDKNTTVPNGGTRSVLIKDQPVADTTGGLIVHKIDPDGNLLPGACFQLRDEGVAIVTVCDDEDGDNDGRTTFTDIDVNDYRLRETQPPSAEYNPGPDTTVNIFGGIDDQVVEIVNSLKPARLVIRKVADDGTTLLGGACFGLDRGSGIEYEACDNGAGDSNSTTGIIRISNIPPGEWDLIETVPPSGYEPAADQSVTLNPGQTLNLTIENQPTPPSANKGTVVINKLVDGELASGACFSLKQGAVTRYAACDGANSDGVIEFASVTVGNYTVHETKAPNPSSWFIIAADENITVNTNQTTEVDIVNTLKPGRILVVKKNTSGLLLQNACFRITPDPNGAGQRCTNATGQVSFDNLPTTQTYKLTETKAPNGYQKGKDVTNISLTPGLTTTVNVIDKKAPPPPDDGSILVIKFFCPAGKSGELTSYLDSSNPGGEKLVQTTGCTKGDARFSLVPKAGGEGIEFNTGADGEYFTTLVKGTWELRELSPQESDNEDVLIYAGQQTTVVVIDYVEPPAPKPATINVIKYTCAPGFGGVYYADFLNSCTAESELTNNVSFRTSGPTVAKRITGASGQPGRATFTQLKAGDYTLFEDAPSTAVSVYAFCGYDVYNWADWYSATGSIFLPLTEGANVTCIWFNVPDDLSDSTGAIVVHKYVCNGQQFPSGYDYFGNCQVEADGAKFAISFKQGNKFVPKTTGITNQNGILSFGRLSPGSYSLKEVGGDWCHAKSDDVDAQGNLIVRAGERTNVWIFNCVPTKQPPNTGSGAMAGVIGGGAVSSAGSALIGFAWPILGLVGFRARKKLRRAA